MKFGEILCTAVLPRDIDRGMNYALQSLPYTFDRMRYGEETIEAYLRRLRNITIGKCAEAAVIRFLRSHGVRHSSIEGATPHTRPDRFDLRIGNEIVDIKTFRIPEKCAEAEKLIDALALVPDDSSQDQWQHRRHYDRFIFGFFAGRFSLTLQQGLPMLLRGEPPSRENIILSTENVRIFITAAPSVAECQAVFRTLPAGTVCLQYPGGTRIRNMGCRIRELTAFQSVVHWGGV